jgi:hypothetical protein
LQKPVGCLRGTLACPAGKVSAILGPARGPKYSKYVFDAFFLVLLIFLGSGEPTPGLQPNQASPGIAWPGTQRSAAVMECVGRHPCIAGDGRLAVWCIFSQSLPPGEFNNCGRQAPVVGSPGFASCKVSNVRLRRSEENPSIFCDQKCGEMGGRVH